MPSWKETLEEGYDLSLDLLLVIPQTVPAHHCA